MQKIIVFIIFLIIHSSSFACILKGEFSPLPVFYDEFDGHNLNSHKWDYRYLGTRKDCTNVKNTVVVSNGTLRINVTKIHDKNGVGYQCGMISTMKSFLLKYGYWEASIRFKSTKGVQLAFWLQSMTNGKYVTRPDLSGVEIDIFEILSTNSNVVNHAVHWNGYSEHKKSWSIYSDLDHIDSDKFNKFGLSWTPKGYEFYINDKKVVSSLEIKAPISNTAQYIIISSEVTNSGFNVDHSLEESFIEVDYVRVCSYLT